MLAGLAPAQAKCNYSTLAFRNVASLESENIGVGTLARAGFVLAPSGPNNEGFPSSAPANGGSTERQGGPAGPIIDSNHLHVQALPQRQRPGPAEGLRSRQADVRPRHSRDRQRRERRLGDANSRLANSNLYGEEYPTRRSRTG